MFTDSDYYCLVSINEFFCPEKKQQNRGILGEIKIERRRIKKSLFGPTFTESAQGQRWLLGLCKPSSRLHSIYRWQGWQVCQDSEELVKSSHASQAILFYDFLSHPLEVDSHQHGFASVPHRDRHYYPAHRQSSTLIRYRASNIAWILAFLFSNIHWHSLNIESMFLSLPHYISLNIWFSLRSQVQAGEFRLQIFVYRRAWVIQIPWSG